MMKTARGAVISRLRQFRPAMIRTRDLEGLVRQANAMAGCRSFKDVVNAFRAMRTLA